MTDTTTEIAAPAEPATEPPELTLPSRFSPSRLDDYRKCPLSFYFKTIRRLSTATTAAQARGTATHSTLEQLFTLPRAERTPENAVKLIGPIWDTMLKDPENALVVAPDGYEPPADADWPDRNSRNTIELIEVDHGIPVDEAKNRDILDFVELMVRNYFLMENPAGFDPTNIELHVEAAVDDWIVHGYIDRFDVSETDDGTLRVYISDYKTGKVPDPRWASKSFTAMRLYAYATAESTEHTPGMLRLLYLKAGAKTGILREAVTAASLKATKAELNRTIKAIVRSFETDDWPAKTSKLCPWCDYQDICPAQNPMIGDIVDVLPEKPVRIISR